MVCMAGIQTKYIHNYDLWHRIDCGIFIIINNIANNEWMLVDVDDDW